MAAFFKYLLVNAKSFPCFYRTCQPCALERNPLPKIRFFLGTIFKENFVNILITKQEIPRTGEHGISNKNSYEGK